MKNEKKMYLGALLVMGAMAGQATNVGLETYAPSQAFQQQAAGLLTGRVVDQNGEPVIGASVALAGGKGGTVTDIDGVFKIKATPGQKVTVSFIGYEKRTVTLTRTGVRVVLNDDANMLDEVQVIAYGTQNKVTATGSTATVSAKELTRTPVSSVSQVLAGQMTGVSSVQYSGEPGADEANIYIRGKASFNDASPLIQLDGVVMESGTMSINDIDPDEIESISVLKDASATAVFGVRGANGVIIITTKRGQEGKARITGSVSGTLLAPNKPVRMVSSYEYATFHNQMRLNDAPDGHTQQFSEAVVEHFRTGDSPILFPSTDWTQYMMKSSTTQYKASLNISGGNKWVKYFVSGGAYMQGGLFKEFDMPYDCNYTYHRYNLRSNLDINVTKTTKISMDISGSFDKATKPNIGGSSNDMFKQMYMSSPFSSPGIVDGKYIHTTTGYNSADQLPFTGSLGFSSYYGHGYQNNSSNKLSMQLSLDQKLDFLTKGLSFGIKGAYNSNLSTSTSGSYEVPNYVPRVLAPGYVMPDGTVLREELVVLQKSGQAGLPSYSHGQGKARNWYFDARFNYSRSFGKHNVSALLLYNQSRRYYPSSYSDIPTGYVGIAARATYNWAKRYMAEFNVGYNGSENFAPSRRFGTFPAGSVGWTMSEEKWFKPLKPIVEYMKLRASWGLVGSDKGVSRFYYTPDVYTLASGLLGAGGGYGYNFGINNGTRTVGANESTKHNPDVGWEKSFKQNYGVDLNFFSNKFKTTFDYYREHRTGILLSDQTAPLLIGFTVPSANLGVVNSWGWEVSAKWQDKIGNDFNYWVGANISYNQNKVIEKKEAPRNNAYQMDKDHRIGAPSLYKFFEFYNENTAAHYQEVFGEPLPLQIQHAPDENGVEQTTLKPGDCVYVDLDHNGVINSDDCSRELAYTEDPEYTLGLQLGFRWKDLELNTQWTGAFNVERQLKGAFKSPFYSTNNHDQGGLLSYHIGNTWTTENPSQDCLYPRASVDSWNNNYMASTLFSVNANYLRLKTLQLAYNFHFPFMRTVGLKSLQLAFSAYNLLTLTPFKYGDPETRCEEAPSYPLQRTYTFTVKVGF